MNGKIGGRKEDGNSSEIVHSIRPGNLYYLLSAFIGSHNRRTDVIGKGLNAIALALSTPQDNSAQVQAEIDRQTASIQETREQIEAARDAAQNK